MAVKENPPESKPNPDPTERSIEAIKQAIAALKEMFEIHISSIKEDVQEIRATVEGRPAAIVSEINHLKLLHDEQFKAVIIMLEDRLKAASDLSVQKFQGVADQFSGRDTALAAALLAQKTSVEEQNKSNALSAAKAEAATTKQIDGIQTLLTTMSQGTDDKIDGVKVLLSTQEKANDKSLADLSTRLTAREGQTAGMGSIVTYIFGGIGFLVGAVSLIEMLMKAK